MCSCGVGLGVGLALYRPNSPFLPGRLRGQADRRVMHFDDIYLEFAPPGGGFKNNNVTIYIPK